MERRIQGKILEFDRNVGFIRYLEGMKEGEMLNFPYSKYVYQGFRTVTGRKNASSVRYGEVPNPMYLRYRISSVLYPGYVTVARLY